MQEMRKRFTISHTTFCVSYAVLVYILLNAINIDKVTKWFYLKDKIDYASLVAFLTIGLCLFITVFTLLAHRFTIKPLAILFVTLGGVAAYFTAKYNAVIDSSMIMNAIYTDTTEVRGLLSVQMIPYFLLFIALPTLAILWVPITFESLGRYLLASMKVSAVALTIAVLLVYVKFDSIHRAINLSDKYLIHTLIPINYIQGIGSLLQRFLAPYHTKFAKKVEVSGRIALQDNLIVVLAIGESSRQQNFSLYGYKRQNTNPILSNEKNLHLLNGKARIGSTLYALPEILVKRDVPLPALTAHLGIPTSCYVHYTLYDICDAVGETPVTHCGHGGHCYDEDVVPLLSDNLKSYISGYRLIVLHMGGGSHGPRYHERIPPEFQYFKPICFDADVVNQCTLEQLYNSYDNTILYVDSVLGKIINKLDTSNVPYVFIYLSDHGESLMEEGRLFHGMPPGIALPPEQAHIPLIVKSSMPISTLKRPEVGQQDVFDTVLGLFSIETNIRNKDRNFININK